MACYRSATLKLIKLYNSEKSSHIKSMSCVDVHVVGGNM
jgi:hypothetical protein